MKRHPFGRVAAALLLVLLLAGGGVLARRFRAGAAGAPQTVRLAGNIDDRQVNLAFILSERIAELCVEEGEPVRKGQIVARLETVRLRNSLAEAEAAAEAARQVCRKVKNGPRAEDIAMARSQIAAAEAEFRNAERDHHRQQQLRDSAAVSRQIADAAEAKFLVARAELERARTRLALLLAGSRVEEIAEAEAGVRRADAAVAILRQQLADAELRSPVDGIVRNRLLEPGEIATPQRAVLCIAENDPKWARVYLPEPLLARVRIGSPARVTADGLPGREFEAHVGFLSPSAEFTPKNVETVELRPSLVYELRVLVKDPENRLKLGAPVTVRLDLAASDVPGE